MVLNHMLGPKVSVIAVNKGTSAMSVLRGMNKLLVSDVRQRCPHEATPKAGKSADVNDFSYSSRRRQQTISNTCTANASSKDVDAVFDVRGRHSHPTSGVGIPQNICSVHVQHDVWLVLLEGAMHLVEQPLIAANVGC